MSISRRESWLLVVVPLVVIAGAVVVLVARHRGAADGAPQQFASVGTAVTGDLVAVTDTGARPGRDPEVGRGVAPSRITHEVSATALQSGGLWTGMLQDAHGRPLTGGTVLVRGHRNLRLGDNTWLDDGAPRTFELRVGAGGTFAFQREPGWVYDLVARADGYAPAVWRIREALPEDGRTIQLDTVDLIDGRVTRRDTGAPIAEARVTLHDGANSFTTATDAQGHYSASGFDPHSTMVEVTHPSVLPQWKPWSQGSSIVADSGTSVTAEVDDAFGSPLPNAIVWAIDRCSRSVVAVTQSNAFGQFSFSSVPPGCDATIVASTGALIGEATAHTSATGTLGSVSVTALPPWSFDADVVTSGGAQLSGASWVLSRVDGLPMSFVTANVTGAADAVGHVHIQGLCRSVTYQIAVFVPGLAATEVRAITWVDAADGVMPIALAAMAPVSGQCKTAEGVPIVGATVRLTRSDAVSAPALFTTTGANGTFSFEAAEAGTISIVAMKPGFDNARATSQLPVTGLAGLTLTLHPFTLQVGPGK